MPSGSENTLARNVALGVSAAALAGATLYLYSKCSTTPKQQSAAKEGAAKNGIGASLQSFWGGGPRKWSPDQVSTQEMLELLTEIVDSQNTMKELMEQLGVVIRQKDLSFFDICEAVTGMEIPDALQRRGFSVEQFSQLLAVHNSRPDVRQKILQLTASPYGSSQAHKSPAPEIEELARNFSVEKIIDIHKFMLDELVDVMQRCGATKLNPRVATIAAQAYVGKKVKSEYNISSEGLEALVLFYHQDLSHNQRFFELGTEMRHAVQNLVLKCSAVRNLGHDQGKA